MPSDPPRPALLLLESLLIAAALLGLSAVLVTPTLEPIYMGDRYQEMSSGLPPQELGAEALRPLSPALARWLQLGGARWIAFPLLIGWVWLSSVYAWLRGRLPRRAAAGALALLAFATPITWTLVFPGYVDTMTYLLLWLSFLAAARGSWLWVLPLSLGLLNHESIVFMAPALLIQALSATPAAQRLRAAAGWGALLAAAGGAALWIRAGLLTGDGPPIVIAGGALLQDPALLLGTFAGFEVAWALPVALVVLERREGTLRASRVVLAVLVGAVAQLGLAVDTTRLMGLAFPAIVVSLVELHRRLPPAQFSWVLGGVLAMNLAIPQVFGVPQGLVVTRPLPATLMQHPRNLHDVPIYRAPRRGGPPAQHRRKRN